jgi:hypothetical protein
MHRFITRQTDAADFVISYQKVWRILRDSGDMGELDPSIAEILDKVFTASDCYRSPDARHRTLADIGEDRLRLEAHEAFNLLTAK